MCYGTWENYWYRNLEAGNYVFCQVIRSSPEVCSLLIHAVAVKIKHSLGTQLSRTPAIWFMESQNLVK